MHKEIISRTVWEILEDFKRFQENLRVLAIFSQEKSALIGLITDNSVKKRKENNKKVLQKQNIFVIINAVKL